MHIEDIRELIHAIPKVELHLHIEGTLEPGLLFDLARRNKRTLRHDSVQSLRDAYEFDDLQSFLDIYYEGAGVLIAEQDFYDLAWAYLQRAASQNVRHTEIFFDPQTHTERGVDLDIVVNGLSRALADARREFGLTSRMIPCFLRHMSAEAAMQTLADLLPFKAHFAAVGLDSSEAGFPPQLFESVFARARRAGLRTVAHAGEEGPADYIWQALKLLQVSRIDHGVRCVEDPRLVAHLAKTRMPLTVCPLSNVKLRVFDTMQQHNLKTLLDANVCVTVNSDDPAYFGGYIEENFLAVQSALELDRNDIIKLAGNAIDASFLDAAARQQLSDELATFDTA